MNQFRHNSLVKKQTIQVTGGLERALFFVGKRRTLLRLSGCLMAGAEVVLLQCVVGKRLILRLYRMGIFAEIFILILQLFPVDKITQIVKLGAVSGAVVIQMTNLITDVRAEILQGLYVFRLAASGGIIPF